MAFNIQEIQATINRYGGNLRTSHFDVAITAPQALLTTLTSGDNGMPTRDLVFFAEAAELPGVSLQTSEIKHSGYGLIDKRPYKSNFVDTNIRFAEDANAKTINFFQTWVDEIANFSDRTNGSRDQMRYPDEYQTTIEVTRYDPSGNKVLVCSIYRASQITVAPVTLDWATQNEISKFTVTFGYESWKTSK